MDVAVDLRLDGKVALITGAAGEIGAAAAERMAERGARIVAIDRSADALARLVARLPAGSAHVGIAADASDEPALAAAVRQAVDAFGRIDVFFNHADAEPAGGSTTAELALGDFARTLETQATAVFLGLKHGIPALVASGGGAIVHCIGPAGIEGVPGEIAQVAGNAAVLGMTRTAALEWGEKNIRVNCVQAGGAGPERARDVANLVAFLCSDAAAFTTGALYPAGAGSAAAGAGSAGAGSGA